MPVFFLQYIWLWWHDTYLIIPKQMKAFTTNLSYSRFLFQVIEPSSQDFEFPSFTKWLKIKKPLKPFSALSSLFCSDKIGFNPFCHHYICTYNHTVDRETVFTFGSPSHHPKVFISVGASTFKQEQDYILHANFLQKTHFISIKFQSFLFCNKRRIMIQMMTLLLPSVCSNENIPRGFCNVITLKL